MKGTTWPVAGVATAIPDFQYLGRYNGWSVLDFGPQYVPQDESGIATQLPPYDTGRDYAILVPQVDPATGLALAGIRSVAVRAPLGTSLEFNPMSNALFGENLSLSGAYIPFHTTEAARLAAGIAAVQRAAQDVHPVQGLLTRRPARAFAQRRGSVPQAAQLRTLDGRLGHQWDSRGTGAPLPPTRKSRSAPWCACCTWST